MAERATEAQVDAGATETSESDFASLLQKEFKPRTETAKTAVETAVNTLAQQALENANLISEDVLQSLEAMVAEIDRKLSEQINQIIHHDEYQQLESAWRGLHFLVNNTETDEMLKIRVLNISKKDLHKTVRKFKGTAWDQKKKK